MRLLCFSKTEVYFLLTKSLGQVFRWEGLPSRSHSGTQRVPVQPLSELSSQMRNRLGKCAWEDFQGQNGKQKNHPTLFSGENLIMRPQITAKETEILSLTQKWEEFCRQLAVSATITCNNRDARKQRYLPKKISR